MPKSPNRKNELIELFQSNSLNRPQSLCNLGVESPSRLEKCPNRVGEEMAFCVTQKEKDEICRCKRQRCVQEVKDLFSSYTPYTTTIPRRRKDEGTAEAGNNDCITKQTPPVQICHFEREQKKLSLLAGTHHLFRYAMIPMRLM